MIADIDTWVRSLTLSSDLSSLIDETIDHDADAHFDILKILGRGGFGEMHHVRSKLSLDEYAVSNNVNE